MLLTIKNNWFHFASMILAAVLFVEVIILFVTDNDAIVNAQPAYEITLVIVGIAAFLFFIVLLWKTIKDQKQLCPDQ